jgi:hypothetical protein
MCWLKIRSCFFVATLILSTNRIASSQDVKTNLIAAPEAPQVVQTVNKGLRLRNDLA